MNAIRNVLYFILKVLFFASIWSVLHEELSIRVFVFGLIFGFVSIFLTKSFLSDKSEKISRPQKFPFLRFFVFIFVLIFQIYKSGFVAIGKILKGRFDSSVVNIETDIENDFLISAIANAITLTPGTVTLEKKGNSLKVLWLDPVTDDSKIAGEIIKGLYEKIF